jgi:hypothetical protein
VPVLNVTPLGRVPVSLNVGGGLPVAVTVNEPATPTANVALLALVIVGAVTTVIAFVSVSVLVAFEVHPSSEYPMKYAL